MYNKNDHLAKWSIFQLIDVFFRLNNPFTPRPNTPFTHVVYSYNDVQSPKGHIGSRGGGASKNKLKDTSIIFSMTNITILSIIVTFVQKEYCKVLETKGIYILNNLVLLLFETYNGFT